MKLRLVASLLLFASISFFTGCPEQTTIARVTNDPARYRNKEILVVGQVTNSFGALGEGIYELSDETGKIWVITRRGTPSKGARVGAVGKYVPGVTWAGRSLANALQETDRKQVQ